MESDYGAVDGFDEPPHAFISSLLSKPIIEKKLADRFFQGDERRVEREIRGAHRGGVGEVFRE